MLDTGKQRALETTAIGVYAALLVVISFYHEPWFDESQAWLIARDSSLFDMIWKVMRYEGHTPLWHLSLFIPAQLGVPFEIGLKSVSFVFAAGGAAVFIKCAPFPFAVRLLLPFTYFLFYQYGVISRCYSLFVLLLWLTALVFPKRNRKPLLFSFLLALLGGVTAYGMLIAFGIAMAWFLDILFEHRKTVSSFSLSLKRIFSDRRLISLIILGLVNCLYVAILLPMPDRHTPPLGYPFSIADIVYRLLIAPVGAVFFSENPEVLSSIYGAALALLLSIIGLFLIVLLLVFIYKCKMLLYGLLPYLSVVLFITLVYFSIHHTGIYALLALFLLWIVLADVKERQAPRPCPWTGPVSGRSRENAPFFKWLLHAGLGFVLALQIYWSCAASMNDIRFPYAPYRELASFLNTNEIAGHAIFDYYYVSNGRNAYFTKNMAVLAYFSGNIFYNHNLYNRNISYAQHRRLDADMLLDRLNASANPEFIIGHANTLSFYDNLFSLSDYAPVKSFSGYYMWKDIVRPDSIIFYIRKDLLPNFSFPSIRTD